MDWGGYASKLPSLAGGQSFCREFPAVQGRKTCEICGGLEKGLLRYDRPNVCIIASITEDQSLKYREGGQPVKFYFYSCLP